MRKTFDLSLQIIDLLLNCQFRTGARYQVSVEIFLIPKLLVTAIALEIFFVKFARLLSGKMFLQMAETSKLFVTPCALVNSHRSFLLVCIYIQLN